MKKDQYEIIQASAIDLLNNSESIKYLIELSMSFSFKNYNKQNNEIIFNEMMVHFFQKKALINLAYFDGEICGFIWFFQNANQAIHINHLAVKENSQGKGIGKKLLNSVEEFAKYNNTLMIELFVSTINSDAEKFYRNNNFKTAKKLLEKNIN